MKVLLVCAAGMSTSMLMRKMEAHASENGIALEVSARSASELKAPAGEGCDCILIGPQIAYQKDAIAKKAAPGVPVEVIPMKDYGRQNCPAIFELIERVAG